MVIRAGREVQREEDRGPSVSHELEIDERLPALADVTLEVAEGIVAYRIGGEDALVAVEQEVAELGRGR